MVSVQNREKGRWSAVVVEFCLSMACKIDAEHRSSIATPSLALLDEYQELAVLLQCPSFPNKAEASFNADSGITTRARRRMGSSTVESLEEKPHHEMCHGGAVQAGRVRHAGCASLKDACEGSTECGMSTYSSMDMICLGTSLTRRFLGTDRYVLPGRGCHVPSCSAKFPIRSCDRLTYFPFARSLSPRNSLDVTPPPNMTY